MPNSLTNRAIDSMIWVTIDKGVGYTLVFLSNLVLARLLLPEDFGCIAMINVFIAISDILIHGGFGAALIQKKETSQVDYSSVFFINLLVSFILYVLLFLSAPAVASFYKLPLLNNVLRVQSLVLIINSFTIVQVSILQRNLRFKSLAMRNIISGIIGLICGVVCALNGMGVWSLVISTLASRFSGVFLLWRASEWRPSLEFSFHNVKGLFGFGGFMMASSIIGSIYDNLQSILIGKFYTASDLGYVNQAKKLESIPSGMLSSVVSQVSFPVFSSIQDNCESVKSGLKKNIKSIEYINMPMTLLLILIAEPLITLMYGERWCNSVPYFQILCFSRLIGVIVPLNMTVVSSQGHGKQYFLAQLVKFSFSIIVVLISLRHGIYALLMALATIPLFDFVVWSFLSNRILKYGTLQQLIDILPTLIVSMITAGFTYVLGVIFNCSQYIIMVIQIITYVCTYIALTKLFRFDAFYIYQRILKEKVLKTRGI